jgi:hypothetical protein
MQTIIFLHIPKAGGTTLRDIISRQYPKNSILTISHFKESLPIINQLTTNQQKSLRIIQGHLLFGIHKNLSNHSTYISMVRNPVEHILSGYYYLLNSPTHPLYKIVKTANMSFEEYLTSGINHMTNNPQVRTITGVGVLDPEEIEFGRCPNSLLEQAITNIKKHFIAVGITERFNESILVFKKLLNWSTPYYSKANVTRNRPKAKELTNKMVELINEYNELDFQLYDFVNQQLDCQIETIFTDFTKQLNNFELANNIIGKIMIYQRLKRLYQRKLKLSSYKR